MASRTRAKYVMSVAADLVDMHPQTLRKYEREGLLEPARYDGYHRMYTDDDLARLLVLKELSQTRGVNVAGLRVLMELLAVVDVLERLLQQPRVSTARMREEVARLREMIHVAA